MEKLTDDGLDQIKGNFDKMAGKLQEHYGYGKKHAENEASPFFKNTNRPWNEAGTYHCLARRYYSQII